jgi:signal transduction histidine kinase
VVATRGGYPGPVAHESIDQAAGEPPAGEGRARRPWLLGGWRRDRAAAGRRPGRAQGSTLVMIVEDGAIVTGPAPPAAAHDADPELDEDAAGERPGRCGPRELFQIVEDERMRIARDMHDGPAQLLANLVLKAEIVGRLVAEGSDRVVAELADFQATARLALEETRRLIFDLRPMSLDDLGLAATLRRFLCDVEERDEIRTTFRLAGDERRLPPQLEQTLYRVVQEAVNNARRHARPTCIDVSLTVGSAQVTATVRDNGCGFDPAAPASIAARGEHLGLVSMRERAALHGGVVDILSTPGTGTLVRVVASY